MEVLGYLVGQQAAGAQQHLILLMAHQVLALLAIGSVMAAWAVQSYKKNT